MDLDINLTHQQGNFRLEAKTHIQSPILGLYGPSGAGKTTLFHLLSGLKSPQQGTITLKGKTLFDKKQRINLPPEKRQLGVLFQDHRLFPHLKVKENITFGISPKNIDHPYLNNLLKTLEIESLQTQRPNHLSGGEKQRVALARALIRKPKLLLLDEPFTGIDTQLQTTIIPYLNRIHQQYKHPIIIISHNLPDLQKLTDTLLLLKKGKIIGQGNPIHLAFHHKSKDLLNHTGLHNTFQSQVSTIGKNNITLKVKNQTIKAPYKKGVTLNSKVKAHLRPEDIIISPVPVENLSTQNQLKATITRLDHQAYETLLELNAGTRLLSRVTHQTAQNFQLKKGKEIWIHFKTVAVDYH